MATEDDVRRIALRLPEVTEKPSYNTPGFRVKDKLFLRIRTEAEGCGPESEQKVRCAGTVRGWPVRP